MKKTNEKIELLSPARNLECGIAAIDHGADAVYIGAERFGARAAVGNSVDDIATLCRYAHRFGAKVYVTVNTLLRDDELDAAKRLVSRLKDAGADAVLLQDMALVEHCREIGMAIHASTQTDNRTAEKVRQLRAMGFSRVVLARELSAAEIRAIHEAVPDVELEVFVHGALCVCYSGICYASEYCFGRSANRGECAQFCRMPFDLVDADGTVVERNRYLLSLKDLCQIDHLQELVAAGAVSFKIEGRLKDISYVKNVTAAYSQRIDEIVRGGGDYRRASLGRCKYTFTPNLAKTFNRGYTTYFLNGRQPGIVSMDTPKAVGEYVGKVKEIRGNSFNVAGTAAFANGDGLCFVNDRRQLEGFRVNRVEGNRLFPLSMPKGLRRGTALYRNNDQDFERTLSRPTAERKIPVTMRLTAIDGGFRLEASVAGQSDSSPDKTAVAEIAFDHQRAATPQRDNIVRQLTKLGNTVYTCDHVEIPSDFDYFIPSSLLAQLRKKVFFSFSEECGVRSEECFGDNSTLHTPHSSLKEHSSLHTPHSSLKNHSSLLTPHSSLNQSSSLKLMQCRHCIRYSLGFCVKNGGRKPEWREPLSLVLADGRRFRLEFDCRHCQMNVVASSSEE